VSVQVEKDEGERRTDDTCKERERVSTQLGRVERGVEDVPML
jgi:hypothetical protein